MKSLKLALIMILLAPLFSTAAAAHASGETHEQIDATRYYSGQKTELTADYANDVFYLGQELTTSGDIGDNLLGLAGKVVINENVYNSVYIAAGQVQIDGNVSNDLNIVGGYVVVNGYVGGDLRVSGGTVIINSPFVGADLAVAGGEVYINEQITVTGKQTVSAGDVLTTANGIPTDLSQAPSLVSFTTVTELVSSRGEKTRTIAIAEGIVDWITTVIGQIIAGYVMLRLFPVFATKTMKQMRTDHVRIISVGLATLFCALLLIPILLFSVIGTKLLFMLIVLGVLALYLGQLYASYMLALMLLVRIQRPQNARLVIVTVAVLLVNTIIPLLGLLPVIGGLLAGVGSLTLYCWGLGAIILGKYQAFTKRKSS